MQNEKRTIETAQESITETISFYIAELRDERIRINQIKRENPDNAILQTHCNIKLAEITSELKKLDVVEEYEFIS